MATNQRSVNDSSKGPAKMRLDASEKQRCQDALATLWEILGREQAYLKSLAEKEAQKKQKPHHTYARVKKRLRHRPPPSGLFNDTDVVEGTSGRPALVKRIQLNDKTFQGMVWDPINKVWKGNEQDLEVFRTAKPILIAPMGNSSMQTANIFLQASKLTQAVSASNEMHSDVVSDESKDDHLKLVKPEPVALPKMTFDPVNKCWIGNEEEEDIFKDISIDADTAPTSMPPEFRLTQQDKDLIRHCERAHDECLAGWASHSDICTNPVHKDALRNVSICLLLQFINKGRIGDVEITDEDISSSETEFTVSSPKIVAQPQKITDVTEEWGDDLVIPDAPLELCPSHSTAPDTETDAWDEKREKAPTGVATPTIVSSKSTLNLESVLTSEKLVKSSSMPQPMEKKGPKLFTLDMLSTLKKQQEEDQKTRKFLKLPESGGKQPSGLDDLDDLDWGDALDGTGTDDAKEASNASVGAKEPADANEKVKVTEKAEGTNKDGKGDTDGDMNIGVSTKPAKDGVEDKREEKQTNASCLSNLNDDWCDDFDGEVTNLNAAKKDGQGKEQQASKNELAEDDWCDDFGDSGNLTLSLPSSQVQKEAKKEESKSTDEKEEDWGSDFEDSADATACLPKKQESEKAQKGADADDWDSAFGDDSTQQFGEGKTATTPNSVKSLDLGNGRHTVIASAKSPPKELAIGDSSSPAIALHSPSPFAKEQQSKTPPPQLGAKQPKSVKFAFSNSIPKLERTRTAVVPSESKGGDHVTRRTKTFNRKYQTVVIAPGTRGASGAKRCRPIRMNGKAGLATASRALVHRVLRTTKAQHDADFLQNLADDVALRQPSDFLRSRRCVRALCKSVYGSDGANDGASVASTSSVSDLDDLSDGESVEDWGDVEVPETPLHVVRPSAAATDTYDDLGVDAPPETLHEEHHSPDPLFSDDFETPEEEPLDNVFKTTTPLVVTPTRKEQRPAKPDERGGGCTIQ